MGYQFLMNRALPILVIILIVGQIISLLWLNRLVGRLSSRDEKLMSYQETADALRSINQSVKTIEGNVEILFDRVQFVNELLQLELDIIKEAVQFNSAYSEFNNSLILDYSLISESQEDLELVLEQTAVFRENFMQAKLGLEKQLDEFYLGGGG